VPEILSPEGADSEGPLTEAIQRVIDDPGSRRLAVSAGDTYHLHRPRRLTLKEACQTTQGASRVRDHDAGTPLERFGVLNDRNRGPSREGVIKKGVTIGGVPPYGDKYATWHDCRAGGGEMTNGSLCTCVLHQCTTSLRYYLGNRDINHGHRSTPSRSGGK
jgi:hypothetical protein